MRALRKEIELNNKTKLFTNLLEEVELVNICVICAVRTMKV